MVPDLDVSQPRRAGSHVGSGASPLFVYFSVVFALTWTLWFAAAAAEAPLLRSIPVYVGPFWHLPLFFILNCDTHGQSFPFYLLRVTTVSVALAWVYVKTEGSLLVTMLFHAAINNTKDIVPSAVSGASNPWSLHASPVGWRTLAILSLCALAFLFDVRRTTTVGGVAEAS